MGSMNSTARAEQSRKAKASLASEPPRAQAKWSPSSSASAAASTTKRSAPLPKTSFARADFARAEDSSRSTRRFLVRKSAAPIPPEPPTLFSSSPRLQPRFRNLVGKHAQLPLVEHRGVDHAAQNLFDRAVAEPVDDTLDCFCRNAATRLGCTVHIGSSIHRVRRVALLFQPSQHRPNRRFLEAAGKPFTHLLSRYRSIGPDQLHYLPFEVAQFGQAFVHLYSFPSGFAPCNATDCRIRDGRPQPAR